MRHGSDSSRKKNNQTKVEKYICQRKLWSKLAILNPRSESFVVCGFYSFKKSIFFLRNEVANYLELLVMPYTTRAQLRFYLLKAGDSIVEIAWQLPQSDEYFKNNQGKIDSVSLGTVKPFVIQAISCPIWQVLTRD